MAITKVFKRNEDGIRDGVWFEAAIDESNGKPIKIKIARAHNSNPDFKRGIERQTRGNRNATQRRNAATDEVLNNAVKEVILTDCIRDWENVVLDDAEGPLAFTKENVRRVFDLLPEFLDACVAFAIDDANYVGVADPEADVKN